MGCAGLGPGPGGTGQMPKAQTERPVPNAVARVDSNLCTACGLCLEVCLMSARHLQGTAIVDETRCVGCGACVEVCPAGATSLVERSVKEGELR